MPRPILDFHAKIPRGCLKFSDITYEDSFKRSTEVPTPILFGDFAKLFLSTQLTDSSFPQRAGDRWVLQKIDADTDMKKVLQAVNSTSFFGNWTPWLHWSSQTLPSILESPILAQSIKDKCAAIETLSHSSTDEEISALKFGLTELEERLAVIPDEAVARTLMEFYATHQSARVSLYEMNEKVRTGETTCDDAFTWPEETWWGGIRATSSKHDSEPFRRSLLFSTAVIACQLGLNAVEWAKEHLQTYLLVLPSRVKDLPDFETLVLGPKDLDVGPLDIVEAYSTVPQTYLTMKPFLGLMPPRVIGITPFRNTRRLDSLHVSLYAGIPLAIARSQLSAETSH